MSEAITVHTCFQGVGASSSLLSRAYTMILLSSLSKPEIGVEMTMKATNPLTSKFAPGVSDAPIRRTFLSSVIAATMVFGGTVQGANPASGTTSSGQSLDIEIFSPSDGDSISTSSSLEVTGRVAIDTTISENTSVVFVVDVSGSTTSASPINDCNGDGVVDSADDFAPADNSTSTNIVGSTLDCEVTGVQSLNDSLGSNENVKVGLVVFATRAASALGFLDSPDEDSDSDGTSDLDEYLEGIHSGIEGTSFSTNFSSALIEMVDLFDTRPSSDTRIAYFLTDGAVSSVSSSSIADAAAEGITVHTYAIGGAASDCVPSAPIQQISDGTGGSCTEVEDPSTLSAVLSADGTNPPPGIANVVVRLNGTSRTADVNSIGEFSRNFSSGLIASGANTIEADVESDDGTIVTASIMVTSGSTSSATCNGLAVTVDLNLGQTPGSGDDVILGTPGDDDIRGRAGNDTICGEGGDDYIHGNSGDDWIDGGDGVDNIRGGQGDDVLFSGSGATVGTSSRVFGGNGVDIITGGPDADDLRGGRDEDVISGEGGADMINGNDGDDQLFGGAGADTLNGGGGDNDVLFGEGGGDTLNGGSGNNDMCDGGGQGGDSETNCET